MSGGELVVNIVEEHLSWKTSSFVNKDIFFIASTRAASQTFAFYSKWKSGDDFHSLLSQDFVEL